MCKYTKFRHDFSRVLNSYQKHYLILPFIIKSKVDAVFMYCLYHKKPYSIASEMLEKSKCFVSQENAHTSTSQIAAVIFSIDDDEKFLHYLSEHCYDNEQQFQLAREIINNEITELKKRIISDSSADILSVNRLNSLTIDAMLGYRYQSRDKGKNVVQLPKRFTESLPNDITIGLIIRGEKVSYEVLRKFLMLLKFCNYYRDAEEDDIKNSHEPDKYEVNSRLLDFYDELNNTLISCGFA